MKLLAFAASNSSTSINKRLVRHVTGLLNFEKLVLPDLNDYEIPLYSMDREKNDGIPQLAIDFKKLIKDADKIIISFAEHNGSYCAAFKNIMDWISRIEGDTWESKTFLLMSTSPGGRGGKTVLRAAVETFSRMGAQVAGQFCLPSFHKNFNDDDGILDEELKAELQVQLNNFKG